MFGTRVAQGCLETRRPDFGHTTAQGKFRLVWITFTFTGKFLRSYLVLLFF